MKDKSWLYKPNASFILIGIRGSGKSSLAFLAATAYNRRLVDLERAFFDRTGQSLAEHRKTVSIDEYHKHHQEVLEEVIEDYKEGCVIVCTFSDLEHGGNNILREWARTHPVIHITRDVKGIQSHMRVWSKEQIARLLSVSGPLLRSSSNFEYFNKTEVRPANILPLGSDHVDEEPEFSAGDRSPMPYLTLKRVERDFLKFLRQILGDHSRTPSHKSAYPLSQIPIEERRYTYATLVEAKDVIAGTVDLERLQIGADALQIVFDMASTAEMFHPHVMGETFATVRRSTILPLLIDIYPGVNSPNSNLRDSYMAYIEQAVRLAPEYIIVQPSWLDTERWERINLNGHIKVVGRNFVDGWDDQSTVNLCRTNEFSILQLASETRSRLHNLELENFKAKHGILGKSTKTYLSAFNYGRLGRPSQYVNQGLSPVLPPDSHGERPSSGMPAITARQATKALFASFILDPLQFCIFGADVSYSLSPAMHNAAYTACGLPHKYTSWSTASLDSVMPYLEQKSFGGAAITQPFKIEVVGKLHSLTPHAQFIRAVNTIVPIRDAKAEQAPSDLDVANSRNQAGPVISLHGCNTDWIGIRACIRRGLSPINTIRASSCGLVIGAGGMARAAIYAMIHLGVQHIFLYNRTKRTAEELAEYYNNLVKLRYGSHAEDGETNDEDTTLAEPSYNIHVLESIEAPWPPTFRPPTMVVCSVPAQTPDGETATNFTLPSAWLSSPSGGVVVELAYKPLITPLVRQIRAEAHRGWIIMHGLDMLPEQAFAQFELFTGRRAPRRLMREQVLQRFLKQQQLADHKSAKSGT